MPASNSCQAFIKVEQGESIDLRQKAIDERRLPIFSHWAI